MNFTEIVIHHTVTNPNTPPDEAIEAIRRDHMSRVDNGVQWQDIGYHVLVDVEGNEHAGRSLDLPGAGCFGHNASGVQIAVLNSLDKNTVPLSQFFGLVRTVNKYKGLFSIPNYRIGLHRDFYATECPGALFPEKAFREAVEGIEECHLDDVQWVQETGLMIGAGAGQLWGPKDSITREQLATVLRRLVNGQTGKQEAVGGDTDGLGFGVGTGLPS